MCCLQRKEILFIKTEKKHVAKQKKIKMVINFGAGPGKLPHEVLVEVQQEMLNFGNIGMSIIEISHRAKDYMTVHNETLQSIRDVL